MNQVVGAAAQVHSCSLTRQTVRSRLGPAWSDKASLGTHYVRQGVKIQWDLGGFPPTQGRSLENPLPLPP